MVVVVEERPSAQAERVISDQVKGRVAEQAEFRRGVEKWQFMQRAGGDYVDAVRREMVRRSMSPGGFHMHRLLNLSTFEKRREDAPHSKIISRRIVRREMIPMLSRRARSFACRPKAGLRDI